MLDIVVLFMRVTNGAWPIDDIVDVFPIAQDPGDGNCHPKHAVMILRNVPVDSFERVKQRLIETNFLDDSNGFVELDLRRWFFNVDGLSGPQRNSLRRENGPRRLDIDWSVVKPVCIRKQQGVVDSRPITDSDVAVTD